MILTSTSPAGRRAAYDDDHVHGAHGVDDILFGGVDPVASAGGQFVPARSRNEDFAQPIWRGRRGPFQVDAAGLGSSPPFSP